MADSPVQFPEPASRGLPTPASAGNPAHLTYRTDLSPVRALVLSRARAAGLPEDRVTDLVLAVSEVAANTLRHTRSPGKLTVWQDADEIVCEVRDAGIITDPRAGRVKPGLDAPGGHGLWLVNQVCDRVELTSGAGGTTVRMRITLPPSQARG